MRLIILLSYLSITFSFTAAVPFAQAPTTPAVIPTNPGIPSSTVIDPNVCPKQRSKQCCVSINEISDQLTGHLSPVVPILASVQISSTLAFQCVPMNDDPSNPTPRCEDTVMCCDASDKPVKFACDTLSSIVSKQQDALEEQAEEQAEGPHH